MKKFGLIGLAGYIAERHLRAIKETGNELKVALDKFDSVGIIDRYFPDADFFTEFERFDRHVEKLKSEGNGLDYISICTPNYLHDAHIRFALRVGADAICEKPLVLNPWNLDALERMEKETGRKINTILQLRLHPAITSLKKRIEEEDKNRKYEIDLTYLTSRGMWYYTSWKGDIQKSGGIATNIGIHFFDMLIWVFGRVVNSYVHLHEHDRAAGFLELEKANVRWFLSINYDLLPEEIKAKGQRTYRSIKVDGKEIEFSDGFFDLHTRSYERILEGKGFGIDQARPSIELVHKIRHAPKDLNKGEVHPLVKYPLSPHPFYRKNMLYDKNSNG